MMKNLILIISLILLFTGLVSIIPGIKWQPLFVIKQKEVVLQREIKPKVIKVPLEKKVRVGETYTDLDKNLLAYCIEAGKNQMLQEKRYNWSYWADMEENLEKTIEKLKKDNLIFHEGR